MALWGGIEAGGTKFVCAVGTGPDDIRHEIRYPTGSPHETLAMAVEFFKLRGPADAVGIASFGPIDPNPASSAYGYITTTPKEGWANVDFVGAIQSALDVPVGFDTDVNAAALGEWKWGAAQGLDTFLYLTVGTGIGGGGLANGKPMRGLLHPEMGHIALPRDPSIDPFEGVCPYHGDCLEGLASGPAIQARWGTPVEELPDEHPAWELEAHYLGAALASFICVLSPQRIVLGGGVMKHAPLIRAVREETRARLNGYIQSPAILEEMERYIAAPALGDRSGVLGAIALAQGAAS